VQTSSVSQPPVPVRHVPFENASVGHDVLAPSHISATPHAPVAARHTRPAPAGPADWQTGCPVAHIPKRPLSQTLPVPHARPSAHVVAHAPRPSHTPPRHDVPNGATTSPGHAVVLPSHVSATSHTPVDGRHVVPATAGRSAGHVVDEPLHVSAVSQGPLAGRHTVPAVDGPVGLQIGTPVEQSSAPA